MSTNLQTHGGIKEVSSTSQELQNTKVPFVTHLKLHYQVNSTLSLWIKKSLFTLSPKFFYPFESFKFQKVHHTSFKNKTLAVYHDTEIELQCII